MNKDDFLGRWSKRKLAGEQEKSDSAEAESVEAVTEQVSESALLDDAQISLLEGGEGNLVESGDENQHTGEGEEHEPHPAEGIDIEKLEYDSDFTVFMNEKVPKVLKRMALRKLWLSNPILANVDGLNDYDEDFSDAAAIFINSAGKVISGARDQIWDDDQIAEGNDRIGAEEGEEDAQQETAETEPESIEDTEVSQFEDIEDAEVEDIDDVEEFADLELTDRDPEGSQAQTQAEEAEKTEEDNDQKDA